MSKYSKSKNKKLSQHDRKVHEIARAHRNKGWNVRADLPGFRKPNPIGRSKRIPDVQATKRGATRLFEVETPKTSAKDRTQRRTFQRYATKNYRTSFTTVTTRKYGTKKRKE